MTTNRDTQPVQRQPSDGVDNLPDMPPSADESGHEDVKGGESKLMASAHEMKKALIGNFPR
ncbi:MAG TPA: hypothetical protein VKA84_12175 [Gemmatimonadaceae bacterium]|nr:hypothetical protein [Gemmatimonadaceae bacterium]